MHFREGDTVCGVDVALAKRLAMCVDSYQWCSAGAAAEYLDLPRESVESLMRQLQDDGYLDSPYHGSLPEGYTGKWLLAEETDATALLLWHITSLGKALAKAPIGPPLTRETARQLLDGVLDRCDAINRDDRASHWIDSVTLYGSMCDPHVTEIGDVDVAVVARRRRGDHSDALPRMALEGFLRAGNERNDVVVTDESWRDGAAIPNGAPVQAVFPRRTP